MHYESGVGHIGGNLSCLDVLMCLYHGVLGADDQFVLSKGHSAGALYVTLWSAGRLTERDLCLFHKDATRTSGHPPFRGIPDIQFATGSLGHGLALSAGLALGKRIKGERGRVYCLLSDGELNEGSTWEALIFVCHQHLRNLTFIIDANGLQGFGTTRDVANLDPLLDKFRAFGLSPVCVDGHDPQLVVEALCREGSMPQAIIAETHKGMGVSFMTDKMEWHYLPMTAAQYQQALDESDRDA
jgi:transketolase